VVHPELLGEQRGEAPDSLDVCASVLIPELDCHRQALYRLRLCDLKLRERTLELAFPRLDLDAELCSASLSCKPAEQPRDTCKNNGDRCGNRRGWPRYEHGDRRRECASKQQRPPQRRAQRSTP
jgi:hypothetical protein